MQNEPVKEPALRIVSTVDALAEALRRTILDGGLEPGARLREVEYAERFDVARNTFRAATRQLIHEGLLRHSPNRGVHVPSLEKQDIEDVFRVRAALETEAVRTIIERKLRPTAALQAVEVLSALEDEAPWRAVVDADVRFHQALVDATGSPRLARAYTAVRAEITLCMIQLRPHYDRPAQVAAEHAALIAPILAFDVVGAEQELRTHLREAAANLTSRLDERRAASA